MTDEQFETLRRDIMRAGALSGVIANMQLSQLTDAGALRGVAASAIEIAEAFKELDQD